MSKIAVVVTAFLFEGQYYLEVAVGHLVETEEWPESFVEEKTETFYQDIGKKLRANLLGKLFWLRGNKEVEVVYQNGSTKGTSLSEAKFGVIQGIVWDFFATQLLLGKL